VIAADTYYPINYAVLGALIEHPAHFMGGVLDLVAERCQSQGEPNLTSFVVLGETKERGRAIKDHCPPRTSGTGATSSIGSGSTVVRS
jgi:hypothetical protein